MSAPSDLGFAEPVAVPAEPQGQLSDDDLEDVAGGVIAVGSGS